jgi:hypothetical protein
VFAIAILVVKLLPLAIAVGFFLGGAIIAIAALGISAATVVLGLTLVLALLSSPIWIPILAIMGAISLLKRSGRSDAVA